MISDDLQPLNSSVTLRALLRCVSEIAYERNFLVRETSVRMFCAYNGIRATEGYAVHKQFCNARSILYLHICTLQ